MCSSNLVNAFIEINIQYTRSIFSRYRQMDAAVTDEISQSLNTILFPIWLSVQLHEKTGSVSLASLSE